MAPDVGELVLPGDVIELQSDTGDLDLGPGLRRLPIGSLVTQPGIRRFRAPRLHWVDTRSRRYVAVRGHCVIGQVLARLGDIFRVDIGTHEPATLSYMAFEGATKKNRPQVAVGDLLLARLLVADKDMEPELVCVNSRGKADGLGVLATDGVEFRVPLHVCRKVLSPACCLLKTLGQQFRFEVAVGMNGRVWVRADSLRYAAAVANAICVSEYMDEKQTRSMCVQVAAAARSLVR